jgi:hypothetical protein
MTLLTNADNAGTNKAAHSGTSLNTKRLDDDIENLAREFQTFLLLHASKKNYKLKQLFHFVLSVLE